MDTLSHALWGKTVFGYKGYPKTAIFFGCFPDLSSFGLLFLINILSNNYIIGPPEIDTLPKWLFISYNFGHSLFVSMCFCLLFYTYNNKIAFAMLSWPLHVLIDFPFHSIEYFPTPIFWPLNDYRFDGIPWSNPFIYISNIVGLLIISIWRYKSINK